MGVMRGFSLFWALLILSWVGLPHTLAHAECLAFKPVQRKGSQSCWVKSGSFCLSQALWQEVIQRDVRPCGEWVGNWKHFSPPENSVPLQPKIHVARFQVQSVAWSTSATPFTDWIWRHFLGPLERTREKIDFHAHRYDSTGVFTLLLTGSTHPDQPTDLLHTLGFIHVLFASGIHLYAIARLWGGAVLFWGERSCSSFAVVRTLYGFITSFTWIAAWLLSGARAGLLRPWLVLLAKSVARRCGFRFRGFSPLLISLGIEVGVGLLRGDLHWHSGRWIYALAVGGGLLVKSHWQAAVASWVFAAIWEAFLHGTVSWLTPLLSLSTAGFFSGVCYPLGLAAWAMGAFHFDGVEAQLLRAGALAAQFVITLLVWVCKKLFTLWIVPWPVLILGAALSGCLLFFRPRRRIQAAGFLLLLRWAVSIATASPHEAPPAARLVQQLDVGQGDSALVLESRVGLIDTGAESALSRTQWIEVFAHAGANRLDWIALTHLDADHSGGVLRLASLLPIRCVATSQAEIDTPRGQKLSQALALRGVRLTSLESRCIPYPTQEAQPPGLHPRRIKKHQANENMSAVFVPLRAGGFYLSTGDADQATEHRLLPWIREQIQRAELLNAPRILKLGHHGSKTSSSVEFLRAINPTEVWVSAGVGNRYHHPSSEVLERVDRLRLHVRRTDQEGAITVISARHPQQIHLP